MSSNGETLHDIVRGMAVDRFGPHTNSLFMDDVIGFVVSLLGQAGGQVAQLAGSGLGAVVSAAAEGELVRARRKHPRPYSSGHEGWAVILEEVEEARTEVDRVEFAAADLWAAVRGDNPVGQHGAVDDVEAAATRAVCELVQVVATCRRFREDVPDGLGVVDERFGAGAA